MKQIKFAAFFLLLAFGLCAGNSFGQKMTAEDILAKHLDSIGSAKSRETIKTRIIVSDAEFLQQRQNPIGGKFIIASSTEGALFGINLDSNTVRLDKFSYDGKKMRIGFIQPGVRSFLGGFILSYDTVLKEGLLGGTLSSSWALLNVESRKAKLKYDGTEKIDGTETYIVEFEPKGGADISIKMYFDVKKFQHLRTEYSRVIGARLGRGGVDSSGRETETRYKLIEDFSNFKKFGELTLPSSYKINYTVGGGAATVNYLWKFKVTDASFNQPLGDNAFDIDAN